MSECYLQGKVLAARPAGESYSSTTEWFCVVALLLRAKEAYDEAVSRTPRSFKQNYQDLHSDRKYVHKTNAAKSSSFPLHFQDEAFRFNGLKGSKQVCEGKRLLLEVWRVSRRGKAEFVGDSMVDLDKAFKEVGDTNLSWWPVYKRGRRKASEERDREGEVHLLLQLLRPQAFRSSELFDELEDAVDAEQLASLTAQQRRRQEAIYELINTERSYVRDLQLLNSLFVEGIRQKGLLSKEQLVSLFGNVDTLLRLHQDLLRELELLRTKKKDKLGLVDEGLGELFLTKANLFKHYAPYSSNHTTIPTKLPALRAAHPELDRYLEECFQSERCRHLPLDSFLIMPLQRMVKYPLLLEGILHDTPEDHPDHEALVAALQDIRKVLDRVNERTLQEERTQRMLQLQSYFDDDQTNLLGWGRYIVREGRGKLLTGPKQSKKVFLVLFNDSFIIAKIKKSSKKTMHLVLLHSFTVVQLRSVESSGSGESFEVVEEDNRPENCKEPTTPTTKSPLLSPRKRESFQEDAEEEEGLSPRGWQEGKAESVLVLQANEQDKKTVLRILLSSPEEKQDWSTKLEETAQVERGKDQSMHLLPPSRPRASTHNRKQRELSQGVLPSPRLRGFMTMRLGKRMSSIVLGSKDDANIEATTDSNEGDKQQHHQQEELLIKLERETALRKIAEERCEELLQRVKELEAELLCYQTRSNNQASLPQDSTQSLKSL